MDALVPLNDGAYTQQQQLPSSLSMLSSALSRPLTPAESERLVQLERLRHFLATAPKHWSSSSTASNGYQQQHPQASHASSTHPALNRFLLPSGEYVSCVLWSTLYHITGTDIVRALVFRFEAFGRPVVNMKKFEEGVFSDLRNLKPGTDACLEEPKSPFLDLLFKYQCIRTQKKQKVFYWFSVPHDRLFLDALERDLKREKMGLEATTVPRGEPCLSFTYDSKRTLYEQFLKVPSSGDGEGADEEDELKSAVASPTVASFGNRGLSGLGSKPISVVSPADIISRKLQATAGPSGFKQEDLDGPIASTSHQGSQAARNKHIFLNMFSIFEGSPTYKQRRKKAGSNAGAKAQVLGTGSSNGPELAKRRSTLISEAVISRRNSMLTLNADPAGSSHPSHYGSEHPASRPQSSQQHIIQQLPSYGLSMNPTVERSTSDDSQPMHGDSKEEYAHMHPSLQPPVHASIQHHDAVTMGSGATTKAFVCPLLICRRLFRSVDQLKKHMSVHSTSALMRAGSAGGLRFPCNRPGCQKVFSRADTLNLHKQSCAGWDTRPSTASEQMDQLDEENGDMDIGYIQEVEVPVDSKFEDEPPMSAGGYNSVSPPPHGANLQRVPPDLNLSHLQHPRQIMQAHESGNGAPQFAVMPTSAETSPYVETPDASSAHWTSHSLANGYQFQHPHLTHYPSHPNIGAIASPPGSAHSHSSVGGRSVFLQQQAQSSLHPSRFQSPEFGLYNHGGQPSSAPSHKATFDHSSLYPPIHPHHRQTGGMVGVSLRRYRSAAPAMTGTSGAGGLGMSHDGRSLSTHPIIDSRPASSAGESNYDYGTVIVNGSMLAQGHSSNTFAYSVDSGEGQSVTMNYVPPTSAAMSGVAGEPGSDHSSPMSYGNGTLGAEYGESGSPYDGSNGGSPGSVGQATNMPMMAPAAMVHSMHEHPPSQMRGHVYSLSSEIATQQMQQYVDLDGLAGESENISQTAGASASYPHHASSQQYQDENAEHSQYRQPDIGAYPGHSETEEELYQYHYQSHTGAALHDRVMHHPRHPVPYGYPTAMEQPVSL